MPDAAFAAAIPLRKHDFEQHPDGLVTVLVPKFTSRLARRFVMPLLKRPDIRMHLDPVGSTIWLACDGNTTVAQLTALVGDRFGVEPAAADKRVALFLRQLGREGSLAFVVPAADQGPA
jgi:hypothetical protein